MSASGGATIRQAGLFLVVLVLVILSVLWLSNYFGEKIPAAHGRAHAEEAPAAPPTRRTLAAVRYEEVPRFTAVVGTVEAAHTADVGSRLMAQVEAVHVTAGQEVAEGQVLVELDDSDLAARVQQAEAQLAQAATQAEKALRDFEKAEQLRRTGAASEQEYLNYRSAHQAAQAAVAQAEQGLKEAQTYLSFTTIRSPIAGRVVDKMVEPGDIVRPGQALVRLYNPSKMQMVASVPESLASALEMGQPVQVKIRALPEACVGTVSEIVPEATSASRTFQVKVTGPCPPNVYSGMSGRLFIPTGSQQELRVPARAVRTIGQLHEVLVWTSRGPERRFVTVGRQEDGEVEVLTGLKAGEQVVADHGAPASSVGEWPGTGTRDSRLGDRGWKD